MIKAIAFDAYGTIFDVHSVGVLADTIFPYRGSELAALWRVKQIDYTRLRTMSDRYAPFSKVTRDALHYSVQALDLSITDRQVDELMAEYNRLKVFPDAEAALGKLDSLHMPMAILSNGDPAMLDAVVGHAGLADLFDHLLSVDSVKKFKTANEAYRLGPQAFGVACHEILFVSSNCWDACGATWHGYRTFWINRAGQPVEVLDVTPTAIGQSMLDVLAFVATHNAHRAA